MYQGKRFAVVFHDPTGSRAAFGSAVREVDPALGSVLRIALHNGSGRTMGGVPDLLLQEDLLPERVVPDDRYGCDFRVDIWAAMAAC